MRSVPIELSKFEKYNKNQYNSILNSWIKFIKKPNEVPNEDIQKAIEDAGYDKGLAQGSKNKQIEIVKKMLAKNIELNTISFSSHSKSTVY